MPSKTQVEVRWVQNVAAAAELWTETHGADSTSLTEADQQFVSKASPSPGLFPEGTGTYSDVVRAVQDAMRPLLEVHTDN